MTCQTSPNSDPVGAVYANLGDYYLQKERVEHQIFIGYIIALGLIFWLFSGSLFCTSREVHHLSLIAFAIIMFLALALACVLYWLHRIQLAQWKAQQQIVSLRSVILNCYQPGLGDSELFKPPPSDERPRAYWSYPVYLIVTVALTMVVCIMIAVYAWL